MRAESCRAGIGILAVIGVAWGAADYKLWQSRVESKVEMTEKCQAGRVDQPCVALLAPSIGNEISSDPVRVRLFKSNSRRNSDIVVVTKDQIITEVLNIDRPEEREYYVRKYQR